MTTVAVKKKPTKQRLCVYLTAPAVKKLRALAKKSNQPMGELVETAIRDCLQ